MKATRTKASREIVSRIDWLMRTIVAELQWSGEQGFLDETKFFCANRSELLDYPDADTEMSLS